MLKRTLMVKGRVENSRVRERHTSGGRLDKFPEGRKTCKLTIYEYCTMALCRCRRAVSSELDKILIKNVARVGELLTATGPWQLTCPMNYLNHSRRYVSQARSVNYSNIDVMTRLYIFQLYLHYRML